MRGRSITDQLQWVHGNQEKLKQLKTILREHTIALLKSWRCNPIELFPFHATIF